MLKAYIDGACEPVNPGGTASYGVIVYRHALGGEDGSTPGFELVWRFYGVVGSGPEMSNNVGEYSALLALLRWYGTAEAEETLWVCSDSQLVVNQMIGRFKVRKGLYGPYYKKVQALLGDLVPLRVYFKWIPREENRLADELSKQALKEAGIC